MDQDALKELAEQKEKEWRDIQEKRIEALECSLKVKTSELDDEKKKFKMLKDDFKYNLKLLEERDGELDKFEQSLVATRKQLAEKNAEISELKIKIDEMKKHQDNEKNMLDECKKYYLNRLNQKQNEVEKYKAEKDNEINLERKEVEKFKRSLQRQLQDLQFDLEKQRNELKTEFDNVIRKREHEWRLQVDEFNTNQLAKDLEVKMLTNELNLLRETNSSIQANTNDVETNLKNLERKLKEKEWEVKDTIAIKDAKIKEIELKSQQGQTNIKAANEELNRKLDEMDKTIRDKELIIKRLKDSLEDEEKNRLFIENQLNEYKQQIKNLNFSLKEMESKKVNECTVINDDLRKAKDELNKEIELKAKQSVMADLNVAGLFKEKEEFKVTIDLQAAEIKSLKSQLSDAYVKINQIEDEKLQLNLDWQRKYQYLENMKAKDSEEFTRRIMESRDEALDQVKTLEDKLSHKENVIKALQAADPSTNVLDLVDSNEFKLKEENEKLKQVIKQMRKEMENIANEPDTQPLKSLHKDITEPQPIKLSYNEPTSYSNNARTEFEDDLKRQLMEAKQKNRQLQTQIDDFVLKQKLPDNITDNTIINNHIKSLNETINVLRKEKVDLTAFCKKQQTREIHTDKKLNDLSEQLRVKQTQLETLQYEMSSQTRRTTTEINNLKQMLANLELELSATRREADEYHKATIEKNSEIAGLETKVTELKIKLSTSGTQINFGAQELFIQQLQDEIKRVNSVNKQLQLKARQQHHQLLRGQEENFKHDFVSSTNENAHPTLNEINLAKQIENLKSKLKTAAKFMTQLVQEKEHLIEMSNQLRGELNRIKFDNENLSMLRINRDLSDQMLYANRPGSSPLTSNNHQTMAPPKSPLANKLQQLEKKQYELTKQQLAFANKRNITKSDPVLSKEYKSSMYTKSENDSLSITNDETSTVSSSVKSENLREIWKIIDENENDSMLFKSMDKYDAFDSPIKISAIKPISDVAKGTTFKSPRQKKPATLSARGVGVSNEASTKNPKPKIRNYNIKN